MCGIAGIWRPRDDADPRPVVEAMTGSLAHRGPDGFGIWEEPGERLGLGHRRLAVVGLGEVGAQPMVSRSGRWVLTYNGEIYNAEVLRGRLADAGVVVRGGSDTQVLVEALDAWGPDGTLVAVDGMFAFGAWDREQRRLVLARDRMGEKPLVYGQVGGGMAFASELQALRRIPGFDASQDPEAVALFLRYKYIPAPWTIHRAARKLPAGHLVEVRDGRVGEPRPYWSLAEVVEAGARAPMVDERDALLELETVLTASVRRRLRADVPLGSFLSGGIDSSLVTALAAEASTEPIRTFTIGSPDRDHDESQQARQVAAALGTEHTELEVSAEDALAEVPSLASRWDEPFADSSQLPTLLVSRLARGSVTVVLSGDGGDELFGGYNRHLWLPRTWERFGGIPGPVRRVGASMLSAPAPDTWDRLGRLLPERRRPRLLGLKAHKLASVLGAADEAEAYRRLVSHWQDPARLLGVGREPVAFGQRRSDWPDVALTEQIMAVDALTYLPDDVLVKVDRASMSVGLEARVPLLSHHVVEAAARMPTALKVRSGVGKWALRHLLEARRLGVDFDRPKSGFGVPIAAWLRGPLRSWAEDLMATPAGPGDVAVDRAVLRAAWEEHQSGRRDRSYELWDVLMLRSWQLSERAG